MFASTQCTENKTLYISMTTQNKFTKITMLILLLLKKQTKEKQGESYRLILYTNRERTTDTDGSSNTFNRNWSMGKELWHCVQEEYCRADNIFS